MIAARVRPRCQAFMKRLFLRPSITAASAHHLDRVVSRFGITDVHIVKSRSDTKLTARGLHPEWGPVAVKARDPIARACRAYQGLHADGLIAGNPARILPRIYEFGLGYSISEWIEGEESQRVDHAKFVSMPVVRFVDDLAAWCAHFAYADALEEAEILSILRLYVNVTIRRMNYRTVSGCVSACARFAVDRTRLASLVDRMAALVPQLRLPATLMMGDLNLGNVIYNRADDRLVLVDYEGLRPGNYIFDAVFFLSYLMVMRAPREVTDRLARHLFSEAYMGCPVAVRFFRDLASYIVSTCMTIDQHHREAVEANLDAIRTPTV